MKIVVKHQPAYRFHATNETGNEILMDASPNIGGEGVGIRPMEMLLAAIGGCSGIDVVSILNKKKQPFKSFTMEVNGNRDSSEVPSLYKSIHVDFFIEGDDINHDKVIQAVDLSIQKYCSVAKTLEKSATITYSIFVNKNEIKHIKV
jgi:putative redox protein